MFCFRYSYKPIEEPAPVEERQEASELNEVVEEPVVPQASYYYRFY